MSISEISKRSNMILNINDVKNSRTQAELLLTIHESLNQGSMKRGTGRAISAGVIVSANEIEQSR